MACHILYDSTQDSAVLYCSTSGWAFGPVFDAGDAHDGQERAEAFLRWLRETPAWSTYDKEIVQTGRRDPRELTERGLVAAFGDWIAQEADQWTREEAALFAEDTEPPTLIGG